MTTIRLSPVVHQSEVQTTTNIYPAILAQFTPPQEIQTIKEEQPIVCANVGGNRVVLSPEERERERQRPLKKHVFEPITLNKKPGPLFIHDKRWYFRLVQARAGDNTNRSRALMDDYNLNQLAHHMVVCYTPDRLPNQNKPFRTQEGEPGRLYAFFDSYLEFYEYMQRFERNERAFYEVIFGELPQKPHFDIDIDREKFELAFPGEDIDVAAETLRECVIDGCFEVLREQGVNLDMNRDVLLYSSHGPNKRSYHVILNNKCHDGNKEAKAFYDAVIIKVNSYTEGKYRNCNFVDRGVYSPRQQFRLVGCQKWNSGRPKVFYEQFRHGKNQYTHTYTEDVTDPILKKYVIIYESMISFISGCKFLPSLIPEKPVNQAQLGDLPDLDGSVVDQCLAMLREKMNPCPFVIKEVRGHLILLTRKAPSFCPICHQNGEGNEPHRKEHPYMLVVGGKVYWDCRRSVDGKKFFVGYLAMTIDELREGITMPDGNELVVDDFAGDADEFMFGDFNMGLPTLLPPNKEPSPELPKKSSPELLNKSSPALNVEQIPKFDLPPEQRMQNMPAMISKLTQDRARQNYINREAQDVSGRISLASVKDEIKWNPGF